MIPQKFAIANSLYSAVVFSKDVFILSDCFANLSISQNVSCHMCDWWISKDLERISCRLL